MKRMSLTLAVILVLSVFSGCTNGYEQSVANENLEIIKELNAVKENAETKTKNNEGDLNNETVLSDNAEVVKVEEVVEIEEKESEPKIIDIPKIEPTESEIIVPAEPVVEVPPSRVADISYTTKELIATNSTVFNPNLVDRSTNVRLAANHITGIVLMPGQEFSFNKIVGKRTAENGFKPADVFSGNTVVKGIGGGICQTSSTICGAVRKTPMKILEQNPHSMRVSYTTIDNEAMISWGSSDFKFVNTYEFPITIEYVFTPIEGEETITCNIYKLIQ